VSPPTLYLLPAIRIVPPTLSKPRLCPDASRLEQHFATASLAFRQCELLGSVVIADRLADVRLWPIADTGTCTARVCFWSKSGHAVLHCTYPLMTQSGHSTVVQKRGFS